LGIVCCNENTHKYNEKKKLSQVKVLLGFGFALFIVDKIKTFITVMNVN